MKSPAATPQRWAHPLDCLRVRAEHWFAARLALTDRISLNQRNVYILPTGAGIMLGVTLLVLLLASVNYQLNLGYLLTFLLTGCSLVAMQVSHANLRGLTLHLATPAGVFAGSNALLTIHLHNPHKRVRYAIALGVAADAQWVLCDVPGRGGVSVQLAIAGVRRGRQALPMLRAQSLFPLGTFRTWALWRAQAQMLVYPCAERHAPPLPWGAGAAATAGVPSVAGELDDLRPYRVGDPRQVIVWKKVAKAGELISRASSAWVHQELWLELGQTGLNEPEARLRRLCAWVLQAEQLGLRYGLRLGAQEIAPDCGLLHQQHCLELLALA